MSIVSVPKAAAQFGTTFASLAAQVTALNKQVDTLDQKTRYLDVKGTDTIFSATNLYVQSGGGKTDGPANGLGNLILGYNETEVGINAARTGSHNLVIGPFNSYTSYGGAVIGEANLIGGTYSLAIGGFGNAAQGVASDIVGGVANVTSGLFATVLGSDACTASGEASTVTGGNSNVASGRFSSISGGVGNTESRTGGWNVSPVSN